MEISKSKQQVIWDYSESVVPLGVVAVPQCDNAILATSPGIVVTISFVNSFLNVGHTVAG